MISEETPQGPLSEREQQVLDLVLESAGRSNLYKKLGEPQKRRFEEATLAVVNKTLEGADLRTIKHACGQAMDDSGAEDLMSGMKDELVQEFKTKGQGVIPALRTAAKDVLYVLSDSKNFSSVAEMKSFMQRAREIRSGQIQEGRTFHSNEVAPPNTLKTSLHRGNK